MHARIIRLGVSLACAGASFLLASVSTADTIHYQSGFEAPAFTTGPLIGQNGWIGDPATNPNITVQTGTAATGSQAVRMNAAGDPGNFHWTWKPLTTVTAAATTAEPIVAISFDMYLSPLGANDTSTKLWGIDFYNHTNRIAVVGVVDDLGTSVVAGTGADGSQLFNFGPAPTRGAWHSWKVVLDYSARNYDVILDGATLDSDIPFNVAANAAADRTLADADLTGQQLGTDSAFFDNYAITSSAVPEPATFATIAAAAIALLPRRRRRI